MREVNEYQDQATWYEVVRYDTIRGGIYVAGWKNMRNDADDLAAMLNEGATPGTFWVRRRRGLAE
jgi:hypothetical protein